jgi:hypothetical protein
VPRRLERSGRGAAEARLGFAVGLTRREQRIGPLVEATILAAGGLTALVANLLRGSLHGLSLASVGAFRVHPRKWWTPRGPARLDLEGGEKVGRGEPAEAGATGDGPPRVAVVPLHGRHQPAKATVVISAFSACRESNLVCWTTTGTSLSMTEA